LAKHIIKALQHTLIRKIARRHRQEYCYNEKLPDNRDTRLSDTVMGLESDA
jgi:hypothetical protein